MPHLQRTEHRAGLVAVALAPGDRDDPGLASSGEPRVVETVVADRLERLVSANVARAACRGARRSSLDIDVLLARAQRDVGECRES